MAKEKLETASYTTSRVHSQSPLPGHLKQRQRSSAANTETVNELAQNISFQVMRQTLVLQTAKSQRLQQQPDASNAGQAEQKTAMKDAIGTSAALFKLVDKLEQEISVLKSSCNGLEIENEVLRGQVGLQKRKLEQKSACTSIKKIKKTRR